MEAQQGPAVNNLNNPIEPAVQQVNIKVNVTKSDSPNLNHKMFTRCKYYYDTVEQRPMLQLWPKTNKRPASAIDFVETVFVITAHQVHCIIRAGSVL